MTKDLKNNIENHGMRIISLEKTIGTHEAVCAERYRSIILRLEKIEGRFERFSLPKMVALCSAILGLFLIIDKFVQ